MTYDQKRVAGGAADRNVQPREGPVELRGGGLPVKETYCRLMILALLLSVRVVAGQEVSAPGKNAGKTGPAPTATPRAGPAREATVKFIEDYLKGCGEFEGVQAPEGGQYQYILHTPHYRWESVTDVEGRLSLARWSKTYSFNTTTRTHFSWEVQSSAASVLWSSLSPEVEVWQEEESKLWGVALSCTTGSCFDTSRRFFSDILSISEARRSSPRRVEDKIIGNSWSVELCGGESEAERIARAFRHLIELSGGKAPPF